MAVVSPSPLQAVVNKIGIMTQAFSTWAQQVTRAVPLIGTGSPEGVVEATQGQTYMDDAGVAGSIWYVKRNADIAGDRSQGWVLS